MNYNLKAYCVLCVVNFAVAVSAHAQDTVRVERIEVIGSQRAEQRARMSFTIDSTTLATAAGSSTADLLRTSTPIIVRDYGRGARQSISFRGAASTHTSLYWNSLKVNSPIVGDIDFSLLPVYAIDRISVAPGVSAISYGDGALGGAVSIESRPDWSRKVGVDAMVGVSSFSSYNAMAAVRAGSDNFQSSTKVMYGYSLNDFEFVNRDIIDPSRPQWRPTVKNKNADYQNIGVTQDFFARFKNNQSFAASVMLLDNRRNIPHLTTYEGPDNSNLTSSAEQSARAALTYKRFGKLLAVEVIVGATIEGNSFLQRNLVADKYVSYIDSRSWGRSLQGAVNLTFDHVQNHTFRTETSAMIIDAHSSEAVRATGFDRSRIEFSQSFGWYATWHPRWTTSAVARGGMIADKGFGTASLTVDYAAHKLITLSLRGGYNQHFPSLSDLYYTPGGNPNLRPERGETVEVGAKFKWRGVEATLNIYASLIKDWIIWLPTFAQYWTPVNLNEVFSAGAELQASYGYAFDKNWRVAASGTVAFTRTVNVGEPISVNDFSYNQQLPFIPLLSGAASVTAGWRNVSLTYRIEGESAKSNVTSGDMGRSTEITAFDIHTIAIDYEPWRFLVVRGECRNIFDGRFYGALRQPLPPRSFSLSLRFRM